MDVGTRSSSGDATTLPPSPPLDTPNNNGTASPTQPIIVYQGSLRVAPSDSPPSSKLRHPDHPHVLYTERTEPFGERYVVPAYIFPRLPRARTLVLDDVQAVDTSTGQPLVASQLKDQLLQDNPGLAIVGGPFWLAAPYLNPTSQSLGFHLADFKTLGRWIKKGVNFGKWTHTPRIVVPYKDLPDCCFSGDHCP